MKGSLAVALIVAFILTIGAGSISDASTGNAATGETPAVKTETAPAQAQPAQNQSGLAQPPQIQDPMDALTQKIDAVCADPSSAACTAALNQIEPCGKTAPASTLAQAGQAKTSTACSAD